MRNTFRATVFAMVNAVAMGCGASSQNVTAPSTTKCTVTATADPAAFGPAGGTGTLSISTNRECQWTAAPSSEWIQIAAGASGQGDGRVAFSVAANADPAARRAAIAVGGQEIAITQEPAPCTFRLSPSADSVPPTGGRRSIAVAASSRQCGWSASSETDWLTIVDGVQGTGNGQVVYEARPTDGPERTGSLIAAGHRVQVTQGVGCTFTLSRPDASVAAAAGSASVQVLTGAGCPWTAISQAPWITLSVSAGSGPAEIRVSVAANSGPERKGQVAMAGRTFTVTQASGCTFAVSPGALSFGIAGGSGAVQVTTAAACPWSASSSSAWLTVTAGAHGSGAGEIRFSVPANAGPQRSGALTVGGRSVIVTQDSGCTFSIAPASHSLGAGGETRSVQVTTAVGCPWSAVTQVPWIGIASGASSLGPGAAQFVAGPNPGPERSGTLVVAGHTVNVTQGDGCDVALSALSVAVEAGGGTGSVRVLTTSGGCRWTSESQAPWIAITSGADGWGSGEVHFSVQPNPGAARTGTLRIGARAFTVNQAGS